uniref:Uncharacterized protein n=1 Tax=Arundo donax TaxID=35708 RepID=A0A0A9SGH0_ARUDO
MITPEDLTTIQYINSAPQSKTLVNYIVYKATKENLDCLLDDKALVNGEVCTSF